MQYRKKPIVIEATQWFKNGDHPLDHPHTFRKNDSEGLIVRYYRKPGTGMQRCAHCHAIMHDHGWIDTLEGGHTVCPGDWIITGVNGERYPCKPDIFEKTYEKVI